MDGRITEQKPNERVAWHPVDGRASAGVVTFHPLDEERTKIVVQIEWEPERALEKAGAAVGADDALLRVDLERFKRMIESRGT
jgi:uncharacterized membrane protein